jgi:DNA-binding MarR family transcriptional regulator
MGEEELKMLLSKDSPLSNPTRLAILLTLVRDGAQPMSDLKEALSLTYGNLDSHLKRLTKEGYVRSKKAFTRKGIRTLIMATRKGCLAAIDQANALRALLEIPSEPPAPPLEVFVLRKEGRMLAHETLHEGLSVDSDLVGATLTALQDFIKTSWDGEDISSIQFGTRRLLVRRHKYIGVALVLGAGSTTVWEKKLNLLVDDLEKRYGKTVKEWSGERKEILGLLEEIRSFLEINGD